MSERKHPAARLGQAPLDGLDHQPVRHRRAKLLPRLHLRNPEPLRYRSLSGTFRKLSQSLEQPHSIAISYCLAPSHGIPPRPRRRTATNTPSRSFRNSNSPEAPLGAAAIATARPGRPEAPAQRRALPGAQDEGDEQSRVCRRAQPRGPFEAPYGPLGPGGSARRLIPAPGPSQRHRATPRAELPSSRFRPAPGAAAGDRPSPIDAPTPPVPRIDKPVSGLSKTTSGGVRASVRCTPAPNDGGPRAGTGNARSRQRQRKRRSRSRREHTHEPCPTRHAHAHPSPHSREPDAERELRRP